MSAVMIQHRSKESFNSAAQLFERLNPLNTDFWPQGQYIFRGIGDTSYELIPSAHRLGGDVSADGYFGTRKITNGEQISFEQNVFKSVYGCM